MACIRKQQVADFDTITLDRGSIQEHFITLTTDAGETPKSFFQRVGRAVEKIDGQVVSVEVLGMAASAKEHLPVLKQVLGPDNPPINWLCNLHLDTLCGVHLWFVSGTSVSRIESSGGVLGSLFADEYGRYCRLAGMLTTETAKPRNEQAREMFGQMETVLQGQGMAFSDVFRTWFYNDNILAWYADFNGVRDRFFKEKNVYDNLMPASTGIGGGNVGGAALTGGLLAIQHKASTLQVAEVPSPFQSSAADYGSSFSRAVEVTYPDHRRIYVSGTASIDEAGRTVFVGDSKAQVNLTMEVVQAILRSKNMDWGDIVRSLVYFKHAEDMPLFEAYLKEKGLPSFPAIVSENDVCRDNLLFELEADAVKTR